MLAVAIAPNVGVVQTKERTNERKTSNTYFLGTETESHFLIFRIDFKDAILDFISPKQLVSFQVFHAIVSRDELTNAGFANVLEILL
jgi:hypothetical protein